MAVGQWLGVMVSESTHENASTWEERQSDGIRCGSNFKRLNPRTFSLTLNFYDLEFDISYLSENLATLLQIDSETGTPPLLLLRQGSLIARPVFCANISTGYQEPYAGEIGFKTSEVKLTFQLQGGKDSEHAQGQPLTSTPLTDWRNSRTEEQRQRQGVQTVVQELLAPCLGQQGNEQVQALIQNNQLTDANALLRLEPNAFVQMAIAGMIPASILSQQAVQDKLRHDLAAILAQNESGIGGTLGRRSPRRFAEAILAGTVDGLAPDLHSQALQAQQDFSLILTNITAQTLTEDSDVFNREQNPTVGDRFRRLGSCGLSLRQAGVASVQGDNPTDVQQLSQINTFLGDPATTDQQIMQRFGLENEAQIRGFRNSIPFTSKDEFILRVARQGATLSGHVLWGNFADFQSEAPEEIP